MTRDAVYVVDDDASVRDAVSLLLSLRGFPCATFASAEDLLAALPPEAEGCVVADLRMGGMSGLDLQRLSATAGHRLAFVFITAHGDVAAAREAFLAHAVDFLEKPFDVELLVRAVTVALARVRDERADLQDDGDRGPVAPELPETLSARERDVLALLVEGHDNRRIAEALGISHRTVEVHKARVLEKCGVQTVVELVHRHAALTRRSSR